MSIDLPGTGAELDDTANRSAKQRKTIGFMVNYRVKLPIKIKKIVNYRYKMRI